MTVGLLVDPGPHSYHFLWRLYIDLWSGGHSPTEHGHCRPMSLPCELQVECWLQVISHFPPTPFSGFGGRWYCLLDGNVALGGQNLPLNVISPLTQDTGSRTCLGPHGHLINRKFSAFSHPGPTETISLCVRGNGLETDRAQVTHHKPLKL